MLKKILAIVAMLYAAVAFAAVDVNKATAAELDGIKGIGPSISTKIIDERKKGNFKDWNDFVERVKGVGDGNAAKFSAEGLTVNGAGFKGAAAAPAAKADAKPVAAAAPAVPAAKEEKKDPKADAKMKADDAKKAKAEEKAKKAEEAKAKKEAAKQAKADKKAAKADAPAAAASTAKK
jgi:competence protein ComEA